MKHSERGTLVRPAHRPVRNRCSGRPAERWFLTSGKQRKIASRYVFLNITAGYCHYVT